MTAIKPRFQTAQPIVEAYCQGDAVNKLQRLLVEKCTDCGVCVRSCYFLQGHGTPYAIATSVPDHLQEWLQRAYECSLCGLCGAVCPEKLDPGAFFLALRREAMRSGAVSLKPYRSLLTYERIGRSPLFRSYALPEKCDTVLFPGCSFPAAYPDTVRALIKYIQTEVPSTGVVLDCCHKPSHDLGRQSFFKTRFDLLRQQLIQKGVGKVLLICPSCYKVFKQYGHGLEIETVYTFIEEHQGGISSLLQQDAVLHDPCSLRSEKGVQGAVRNLSGLMGIKLQEMEHTASCTLCCGAGGGVGCVNQGYGDKWAEMRGEEAGGKKILTYCAACVDKLSRHSRVYHLLDVLFFPDIFAGGKKGIVKSPWTYLHRLWLKWNLKRIVRCG